MRVAIFLMLIIWFSFGDDYEKEFHIPKDLSFLELNSTQKLRVKKILKEHRDSLRRLHRREERLERSLQKIFLKEQFDKSYFFEERRDLREEITRAESSFFEKMHRVLNKRQRAKFIEYIEEWEID